MRISVIIPAHNEEEVINRSLAAVKLQGSYIYEVIVVCNDCQDRTAILAKNAGARVIVTAQKGVSMARNLGAKNAAGDILVFVDADLIIMPGLAKEISCKMRLRKTIVGTVRAIADCHRYSIYYAIAALVIRTLRASSNGLIFCNAELFHQVGGFPEGISVGEDNIFMRNAKRRKGTQYQFVMNPAAISDTRRLRRWGIGRLLFVWLRSLITTDKGRVSYIAIR